MSITKRICDRHVKTLWWWQRQPTINAIGDCLQLVLDGADNSQVMGIAHRFKGKQRQVFLICVRDSLRYIQRSRNSLYNELGEVRTEISEIQNRLDEFSKRISEQFAERGRHDETQTNQN